VYNRLALNDIPVIKPFSEKTDLITEISHKSNSNISKEEKLRKKQSVLNDFKNWKKDGLSSLKYEILNFEEYKYDNVHKITVKIL
jgi:hypothetical protein